MINIGAEIKTVLKADSAVLALVSTSPSGLPCIEVSNIEPDDWAVTGTGITIYKGGGSDNRTIEFLNQTWVCNCRASTYYGSRELSNAVITALNRKAVGSGQGYCSELDTIPPADKTDNFNTPVNVQVKRRAYA